MPVVLFHAFPKLAPGGYVGVDVFFVISGFLITSNVVENLQRGTFSFAEFYIRRAKRIFPALAVVLLATLAFGWIWLLPEEYAELGKHAIAGAGFATNIVQWTEAGYFDPAAQLKPLLHLWSLGIEEQFYLAWPIIAWMAWRFGRHVFLVAAVIVASSLGHQFYLIGHDPVAAFYLPLPRAWELLLGGCLATMPRISPVPDRTRDLGSVVGAALIAFAVWQFDKYSPFPGWRALLPTVGATLLIWSGPAAVVNRTVLSHPLAVGIGAISYALYLWHWPLLSFLAIAHINTWVAHAAAVIVAVALSVASYFLVERPIRRASLRIWPIPVAGLMVTALLGIAVFNQDILANVTHSPDLEKINRASKDFFYASGHYFKLSRFQFVRVGEGRRSVVLLGDSNMQFYEGRIVDLIAKDHNLSATFLAWGGCVPILDVVNPMNPDCPAIEKATYEYALNSDASTVAIAAQWDGYFVDGGYRLDGDLLKEHPGYDKALASFGNSIRSLIEHGKTVFVVLHIPIGDEFDPKSWVTRTLTGITFPPKVAVARSTIPSQYAVVADDLRRMALSAGARIIEPYASLCDDKACETASSDGQPIYMDANHLRDSYVRQHVRYIDPIFAYDNPVSATSIGMSR